MLRVDLVLDTLPERLVARDQWVGWREQERDGKLTKIPVDLETGEPASTTDDSTWAAFDQARDYVDGQRNVAGLGFVFTPADSFVGVDLDDCRDPGTGMLTEQAQDIVERLDSYTEVSPSGTGVHVILAGALPADRRRSGNVEMYEEARYFTMTGAHLSLTPGQILERSEALAGVHADVVADPGGPDSDGHTGNDIASSPDETMGIAPARSLSDENDTETGDAASPGTPLGDDELVERASEAANSEKFERLWRGNTAGYPSHSEADMALCCLLAFWTSGDPHQMDRLFRRSGLMREKWDEVHYADGRTYGEVTIQRAIRVTSERYEPTDGDSTAAGCTADATAGGAGRASEGDTEAPGVAGDADEQPVLDDDTPPAPDLPDPESQASIAHLREENELLLERVREQAARIEALEAQLARESANESASEPGDDGRTRSGMHESVLRRIQRFICRKLTGPTDNQ